MRRQREWRGDGTGWFRCECMKITHGHGTRYLKSFHATASLLVPSARRRAWRAGGAGSEPAFARSPVFGFPYAFRRSSARGGRLDGLHNSLPEYLPSLARRHHGTLTRTLLWTLRVIKQDPLPDSSHVALPHTTATPPSHPHIGHCIASRCITTEPSRFPLRTQIDTALRANIPIPVPIPHHPTYPPTPPFASAHYPLAAVDDAPHHATPTLRRIYFTCIC